MNKLLAAFFSLLLPISSALAQEARPMNAPPAELPPALADPPPLANPPSGPAQPAPAASAAQPAPTQAAPAASVPPPAQAQPDAAAPHSDAKIPQDVDQLQTSHGRFGLKYDENEHPIVTTTGPVTHGQAKEVKNGVDKALAESEAAQRAALKAMAEEAAARKRAEISRRKAAIREINDKIKLVKQQSKDQIRGLEDEKDEIKHPNGHHSLWARAKGCIRNHPYKSLGFNIAAGAAVGAALGGVHGAFFGILIGTGVWIAEALISHHHGSSAPAPASPAVSAPPAAAPDAPSTPAKDSQSGPPGPP